MSQMKITLLLVEENSLVDKVYDYKDTEELLNNISDFKEAIRKSYPFDPGAGAPKGFDAAYVGTSGYYSIKKG